MPHSAQIENWLPQHYCNLCHLKILHCFQRDNNAQKIFVGGIANGTTEDDLRNYFSAYGSVPRDLFIALRDIQGAKQVSFAACHLGKLWLVYTSPKQFLMSRIDYSYSVILIPPKLPFPTCPLGNIRTEVLSPTEKSTRPGLSDTTFFALWYYLYCILIIYFL